MNIQSILILAAVFVAFALAVRIYRKNGAGNCCNDNCSDCSFDCNKNEDKQ